MKFILLFGFILYSTLLNAAEPKNFMANRYHKIGTSFIFHGSPDDFCVGSSLHYQLRSNKKISIDPGLAINYLRSGNGDWISSSLTTYCGVEGILSLKYRPTNYFYLDINSYFSYGERNRITEYPANYRIEKSKKNYNIFSSTLGFGFRVSCLDFHVEGGLTNWEANDGFWSGINVRTGMSFIFPSKKYLVKN